MKKILITSAIFLASAFCVNPPAFGGCEDALPNQLQACFNAAQSNLTVTVVGSYAYVHGAVVTTGTGSSSTGTGGSSSGTSTTSPALQTCINDYLNGAESCPGAPYLVFDNPATQGQQSVTAGKGSTI